MGIIANERKVKQMIIQILITGINELNYQVPVRQQQFITMLFNFRQFKIRRLILQ
jgi:hypothetical protein